MSESFFFPVRRSADPFRNFDMSVRKLRTRSELINSIVKDSSVVAVQIFDQRKFKRKQDQGFLGVINVKVSDVLDLELGGQGQSIAPCLKFLLTPQKCSPGSCGKALTK
jgi:hypothetical protein